MKRPYLVLLAWFLCLVWPIAAKGGDGLVGLRLTPGQMFYDSLPMRHAAHQINELNIVINNAGEVGIAAIGGDADVRDYFTGDVLKYGTEYPRGSKRHYWSFVSLWVGARSSHGRHIVSTSEMFPDFDGPYQGEMMPANPPGEILRRSSLLGSPSYSPDAIGEEDFIAECTDSLVRTNPTGGVVPLRQNANALHIRCTQTTSGWSLEYAEDFIIVNLLITNTGDDLDSVYVALYSEPGSSFPSSAGSRGAVLGYLSSVPSNLNCGLVDTLNVFWGCNNNGSPFEGQFVDVPFYWPPIQDYVASVRGIMGVRVLSAPGGIRPSSFNWWGLTEYPAPPYNVATAGPSKSGDFPSSVAEYYHFITGDETRYKLMRNREFDYGSIWCSAVNGALGSDWLPMIQSVADSFSRGGGYNALLSWGPYNIPAGNSLKLTYALICGENFHVDPNNLDNLPYHPDLWLKNVDFSDLAQNALMAGWVYDNPGVDTDGDGYFGEYRVCVHDSSLIDGNWVATRADTQWYKGDGIPDYRGALPPPSPEVWVSQTHNGLHIRFNGQYSETEKDIFLQKPDWEGYRIYFGRDERETSLSLIGSYDKLDFDKLYYNLTLADGPEWRMLDQPFTLQELRCLYGSAPEPCEDSAFDPLLFTREHPYRSPAFPDSIFAFVPHDYNTADLGLNTPVTRIYPNAPDPRLLPADSITPDMYTEDGYLKFYEYQLDIENLLPTVPYYVSVTAIDFGSPAQGLNPLESSKYDNVTEAFPMHDLDKPLSGSDKVYVYPNPYRIDADYRDLGYEGRAQDDRWDERVRSIWFGNLPPRCTINIFTLDGDRVRTIEHDVPITDPTYSKERWDLINRNFQIIVSGLYYWTVEAPDKETQIGKLVILR